MNAGIVLEDEDVPKGDEESKEKDEKVKKTLQRLHGVKVSLTEKVTLTAAAEYGILCKKMQELTGSVAW